MEEQLSQLENSIDGLVEHVATLQDKYRSLLEEKESWQTERSALKQRCDSACERIDEILGQIQAVADLSEVS